MREQEVRQPDHSALAADALRNHTKVARTVLPRSPFGDVLQLRKVEETHHDDSD
jgi:hypothetical protein